MPELNELINNQKYLEATQLIERTLDYKGKCKLMRQYSDNCDLLSDIFEKFPDDLIRRCFYSFFCVDNDIIEIPITEYPLNLAPMYFLRDILYKSFRFEKMKKDNTPGHSIFPDDLLKVISWNCLVSKKGVDRKETRFYKKELVRYNEWCYGDNSKFNIFLNEIKMDDYFREYISPYITNKAQDYAASPRLQHFI